MTEPNPQPEPKAPESDFTAGKCFLFGLLLIAIGVGLFLWLQHLEDTGGGAAVHWLIALLYNIGGKWTAGGIPVILGGLLILLSILGLFVKPKKEETSGVAPKYSSP